MNDHVTVLGTRYSIERRTAKDDKALKIADGYYDSSIKTIVLNTPKPKPGRLADLDAYARKCLRHEIVHAFYYESGLACNSMQYEGAWAMCEEMVDWIAIQHEKIHAAFEEAGAL